MLQNGIHKCIAIDEFGGGNEEVTVGLGGEVTKGCDLSEGDATNEEDEGDGRSIGRGRRGYQAWRENLGLFKSWYTRESTEGVLDLPPPIRTYSVLHEPHGERSISTVYICNVIGSCHIESFHI